MDGQRESTTRRVAAVPPIFVVAAAAELQTDVARGHAGPETNQSPSNSATGCHCSTCCDTTFTMTMMGILSSIPQIPHNQPQNSSEINTAAEFMWAIRPVIQVATIVPTKVAIPSDAHATSSAIATESNCRKAAMPVATAATPGPR